MADCTLLEAALLCLGRFHEGGPSSADRCYTRFAKVPPNLENNRWESSTVGLTE
jgi:hypothetical protein